MDVCLVEPFYGGSHRAWADGYATHSMHDVTLVTLPAENWRWRMRGGAVALADQVGALCSTGYRPDAVIVSDMIDLALFRELTFRHWGRPVTVIYFHENQLGYPSQKGTDVAFPWTNWTSALVADEIWFNSRYHLATFFEHIPAMLARFPDRLDERHLASMMDRSSVAPIGVDLTGLAREDRSGEIPRIVWNHRWEHDKHPERFAHAVESALDLDFEVAICGEEPIGGDEGRDRLVSALGERLIWLGFADRSRYLDLLAGSDIVVSTAGHEYFGIAVVEAMAAGCCPVLPNRLSYPELIPNRLHDEVLYGKAVAPMLRRRIENVEETRRIGGEIAAAMGAYDWRHVAPAYDAKLSGRVLA